MHDLNCIVVDNTKDWNYYYKDSGTTVNPTDMIYKFDYTEEAARKMLMNSFSQKSEARKRIEEYDEKYRIIIEMPGVSHKHCHLKRCGSEISISVTSDDSEEVPENAVIEDSTFKFQDPINLEIPHHVDPSPGSITLSDGLLTIVFNLSEEEIIAVNKQNNFIEDALEELEGE